MEWFYWVLFIFRLFVLIFVICIFMSYVGTDENKELNNFEDILEKYQNKNNKSNYL